jgi:hypothetical protein
MTRGTAEGLAWDYARMMERYKAIRSLLGDRWLVIDEEGHILLRFKTRKAALAWIAEHTATPRA